MPKRIAKPGVRKDKGFSLLEVIIIVAVTLVLVAMAGKAMFSSVYTYRVSSSARQIASVAQLARVKAMSRNVRYRVAVSGNSYRLERFDSGSGNFVPDDPGTVWLSLPNGVRFSNNDPVTLAAAPPGMGATADQAAEMNFNTRGLLVDSSGPNKLLDAGCFYLQGQTRPPYAVCSTLPGATSVFRFTGSAWEKVI